MFNIRGTVVSLLLATSVGACAGGGSGSGSSGRSGGFDGAYDCTGTTTTPAGTSSGTGTFSCSQGYCADSSESPPAFTGTVNGNGSFSGSDVLCQTCDPLPMSGQFSTSQPFTISGASGGVSATFTCQCSNGCSGGGNGGTGSHSPTITGLSSTGGETGSTITITVANFPPETLTVTICGVEAQISNQTSNEITVTVPSLATTSNCQVKVVTPTETITSSETFTVYVVTTLGGGSLYLPPTWLAQDSNYVYFTSEYGGTVSKVAKSGSGSATTLASQLSMPFLIAVDSTNAYWTNWGGAADSQDPAIQKVGVDGSAFGTLATGSAGTSIAIDSTYVYWAQGNVLVRTPKTGAATMTLETLGSPWGIAVDSANVYWTDFGGTVNKANVAGGPVTNLASGLDEPTDIAIDSSYVYWTESTGGSVKKVPIAGGSVTVLASGLDYPHGLTVDSTYVYWAEAQAVKKVPLDGGAVTTLVTGLPGVTNVLVDSSNIYWGDNAIREVAK